MTCKYKLVNQGQDVNVSPVTHVIVVVAADADAVDLGPEFRLFKLAFFVVAPNNADFQAQQNDRS